MSVELRRGGLHLSGTPLWLDARRKSELSFVSHAHSDHIARHERVIATAPTLRFLEHRLGPVSGALSVPYRRPFELGPLVIELLPAGHVLGSAQIRITLADGTRVVYTGDLNLSPALTAESAEVAECDILVMESTFGHPRYVFAPKEETFEEVGRWVRAQLERGVAPIVLAYSLGKAQEAIKFLTGHGFDVCAHESVAAMAQLYFELGMPVGKVRAFDGTFHDGEVGVFPPHALGRKAVRQIWPRALAVLTGWAVDPGAARRYGADIAFPVSDHADFGQLLSYAKATGATEVLTLHGFAHELADALRKEGLCARAVDQPLQLDFFGAPSPAVVKAKARPARRRPR
jgi:putative mRNA 3-end processing factor